MGWWWDLGFGYYKLTYLLRPPWFPLSNVSVPGPGPPPLLHPVRGGSLKICALWYGLGPADLLTGGLEVSPSTEICVPLPGTTHTTVGGVVSFLDDEFSDKEYSPLMLALLGVPGPPSLFLASGG